MANWIQVDPSQYERLPEQADVRFEVFVSPYDIPERVRGRYDEAEKRFVIEFEYIVDEEFKRKAINRHLYARVGKQSGRILGFEVDGDLLRARHVAVDLKMFEDAIDRLSPKRNRPERNYEITKRILEGKSDELFKDLAHA
jgi:hypothetical protein